MLSENDVPRLSSDEANGSTVEPRDGHEPVGYRRNPTSEKKIAANRLNSKRSTGPRDTQRTRFNAVKHGLQARGLTPLDNREEYDEYVRQVGEMYPPGSVVEEFCISQVAREMIKINRNSVIEGQNFEMMLSKDSASCDSGSGSETQIVQPYLFKEFAASLYEPLQRYTSASQNRLFKYLRLLESFANKRVEEKRYVNINDKEVVI